MSVIRKLLIGFAILIGTLGLGVGIAAAATDTVIRGTTNHSIYQTGQTISITGTVNGDIFCVGQTVNVDATVNGDVICAGQTVTINGTVHGNIRAAGQTVSVGAKVDHNVTVAGQDVTLDYNGSVGQDAAIVGETVNLDSTIGRDLKAGANTLTMTNSVGRNVDATVNKLQLNGGAKIVGTLEYTSPNTLNKAGGVSVGKTVYHKSEKHNRYVNWGAVTWLWRLYWFLAVLVFSMVLVALFPQLFARVNKYGESRVGWAVLTGFIAMFLAPIIFVILIASLLGLPLAFAYLFAWLILLMLSYPVASFFIGRLVLRNETRAPLIMLVGVLILSIVGLVPFLGWLVTLVAIWYGIGALLMSSRKRFEKPNYTV